MVATSPQRLRLHPLWARVLGLDAADRPCALLSPLGAETASVVSFDERSAALLRRPCYLVEGGVDGRASVGAPGSPADAVPAFLGFYNGEGVWRIGDWYLFLSRNRGAWVLRDAMREPFAYTVSTVQADGSAVETAYGDTWYEGSLPADLGTAARFEARGAGEGAQGVDQALLLVVGADLWKSGDLPAGTYAGAYSAYRGGASGSRTVGFWAWSLDDATYCLDSADREALRTPDGGRIACPGGAWTVRSDAHGAWTADLATAAPGVALRARYAFAEGGDGEAPDDIELDWAGYALVRADAGDTGGASYIYQASRLL